MSDADAPEILLLELEARGARVTVLDDRLSIIVDGVLPPELLERIRLAKPQLLAWLRLSPEQRPWVHVARQVMAGEFDNGARSLLQSVLIGVRPIPHPVCQSAMARLKKLLSRHGKEHP